jgi:hypothetical protein
MKKWILVLAIFVTACSSTSNPPDNVYRTGQDNRPLVDDKYSLQADRKALEEMRAQIPPEKKRQNDELALTLGMMSEVKKSPSDVRSQFDTVLRKKEVSLIKTSRKSAKPSPKKSVKNVKSF